MKLKARVRLRESRILAPSVQGEFTQPSVLLIFSFSLYRVSHPVSDLGWVD